jgi:RNA polymerase primary sigma factor
MDKKYWSDLNKFSPLDRKTEKELAIKAKNGDREAYETLINSNLRFVVSVAKEYVKQGLPLEELVAYGNLGLCKAFKKYDPERNMKFITYAVWWIRQAILQALSEDSHLIKIPHHRLVTKTKLEKTRAKLEQKLQREVSTLEVEEEIGKSLRSSTFEAYHILPLEKSFGKDDKSPIKNALENHETLDPEAHSDHESFLAELDDILSDFTEREQAIIKYYHGIGMVRNLTLEEIGVEFGITRERVRQIKLKVLEKLRHKSRKGRLQPYLADLKTEILNDISSSKQDTD